MLQVMSLRSLCYLALGYGDSRLPGLGHLISPTSLGPLSTHVLTRCSAATAILLAWRGEHVVRSHFPVLASGRHAGFHHRRQYFQKEKLKHFLQLRRRKFLFPERRPHGSRRSLGTCDKSPSASKRKQNIKENVIYLTGA